MMSIGGSSPSLNRMPLQKIRVFFSASDELKALSARARRLRELQTLYVRCAPRELGSASSVKNYRAGTLFVAADNPAVAAKLKQLAPTVLASIREAEPEVTALRFDVQVAGGRGGLRTQRPKRPMPHAALDGFEALSAQLGPSRLNAALKRLLRRHRRSERS